MYFDLRRFKLENVQKTEEEQHFSLMEPAGTPGSNVTGRLKNKKNNHMIFVNKLILFETDGAVCCVETALCL